MSSLPPTFGDRPRVTRVTVRAPVTSFRHPFFVVGRQPSFDIPPPSTVHGLCASALGHWPDPGAFYFGIHFTFRAKARDLEHQHIASALGPKAKTFVPTEQGPARATTEITVQPVVREMLFDVTMTLYLDPMVGEGFRAPVFPVTLGRSQDLAEVVSVEEVTLERPVRARLEHTLLPRAVRPCVRFGATVLLTRHVSEPPERSATFAQYIVLHEPVFFGGPPDTTRTFDKVGGIAVDDLYCDPAVTDEEGFSRGVWLHRLVDPA
jgi:CRISPR-associated protein Cas5t